ncbi:MAG: FecR domain-containing protein [Alphaproteobacteria bacterium]|nr:FecR domain-containing protein [Alphaproteobacteria bacterium]
MRTFQAAHRATAIVAALSLIVPVAAAPPAPATPVGVNAAIRHQVGIRSAGTGQLRPAVLRAPVMLNDEVRTGSASQLQILLRDRSTFTVGANARVAIDRFAYDPATNVRSTGIQVARGAFRFMSGRALNHPSGPASVRTPAASIGIRGTIFEGAVGADAIGLANAQPSLAALHLKADPLTATFVVLRGPGAATQGDARPGAIDVTAGGATVTLDRPDMAVFVPSAGAAPVGPFAVTPRALTLLQPLLRTVPAAGTAVPTESGAGGGSDTGDRRGWPALIVAAIPAILLGLVALGSGHDESLPASP